MSEEFFRNLNGCEFRHFNGMFNVSLVQELIVVWDDNILIEQQQPGLVCLRFHFRVGSWRD